jgi:hypothetical protein
MLQRKEFVTSRLKTTMVLAGSLAFVAIAVLLPREAGETSDWRWWAGGFFGLCSLVFVCLLVRPQRLTLDEGGFTLSGGLSRSPRKVAWEITTPFFIYQLPRGGKKVAYGLTFDPNRSPLARLNRRLGADGLLPGLWPDGPDQLCSELNAYREQALERQQAG